MKRLQDRVALVFGAGSVGPGWGNGKACAIAYAREGARVACVDLNAEAAEETASLVRSEGGIAEAMCCDVTDGARMRDTVAETLSRLGPVAILHNNVGQAKLGDVEELDEAEWRRQLDLNVTGMFLACKHVVPVMLAEGRGAIVNISSVAAIRWTGYAYPSYYAAKGAVNQFTIGLALQYARHGIRANAIMPGLMDTPHIYQHIAGAYGSVDEMTQQRHEAAPMGRMGTAWDVANASVFLASDDAAYITGVCLPVDGGLTARCV